MLLCFRCKIFFFSTKVHTHTCGFYALCYSSIFYKKRVKAPLFYKDRLLESCRHRGVKSTPHPWSRGSFPPFPEPHFGNGVGYVSFTKNFRMQPARIYLEFDISETMFTGILLLGVLFALTWIIYLQEQINWWFNDL